MAGDFAPSEVERCLRVHRNEQGVFSATTSVVVGGCLFIGRVHAREPVGALLSATQSWS
jgi:hypothetical protein